MTLDPYARAFLDEQPFEADRFQIEAVAALGRGGSVVVTAPTGAGKTLVAEAAVEISYRSGRRAFYTTPIKALSNQKFADLKRRYGTDEVGLLTGDNVVNGNAPVIVMTTEVLRNMIYADSRALEGLGVAILDEVHYLQDRARGSVWEEVIIHLPSSIPIVSLSATIANAATFTDWIRSRRGPTELIIEDHRPVPLESVYAIHDRDRGHEPVVFPIFGRNHKANQQVTRLLRKGRGRRRRFSTPRRLEVIEALVGTDLLPAIYFVFSRAGCDRAARLIAGSGLDLTTRKERDAIESIAQRRTAHLSSEDLGVLGYGSWLAQLRKGVGAHHAGLVPAFKEAIEEMFTKGLVKVVFATETLALGINMPARAVVLESLSKFTGESHELLRAGDYTQLTGRAGRRGIDTSGTAVVLHNPQVPFERVADIAAAGSHVLVSSFQPSYNMAVNLVANYDRSAAENLLRASFAQFRVDQKRREFATRIEAKANEAKAFRAAATCNRGDVWSLLDERSKAPDRKAALRAFAQRTHPGDVLQIGPGAPWVLLARGYGTSPRLLLVSSEADVRRLKAEDLATGTLRLGSMDLPEPFRPNDSGYRAGVARRLDAWRPDGPPLPALEAGPTGDGVASCPDVERHLEFAERTRRTERELRRLRRRGERRRDDLVADFHALLAVLSARGYLTGWSLTPTGERLRFVYNKHDLLLSESVESGLFAELVAADLAALASTFTFEARPADIEGGPPNDRVAARLEAILQKWQDLSTAESAHGISRGDPPDPGFASVVHAWASGMELEDLFGDEDLRAGDFVRNCRQLLDLLRQLRDAFPDLAKVAAQAVRVIDRGIVAAGGVE